jgi:Skp family chaperone for outer membrane proteins
VKVRRLLSGAILALVLGIAAGAAAQEIGKSPSDKQLQSFARAYVDFHKIKNDYDARIKRTTDANEKERLRREGDAKVEAALKKQGFTTDSYTKTFTTVNNSEQLRKKTMKYIEDERKKSQGASVR